MAALSKLKQFERISKLLQIKKALDLKFFNILKLHLLIHDGGSSDIALVQKETYAFFCKRVEKLMLMGRYVFLLGIEKKEFDAVLQLINTRNNGFMTKKMKLIVFLKYSREGISQSSLAKAVGVSQSTISRLITECTNDIVRNGACFIQLPKSKEETWTMENAFMRRGKRVRCFAALDGKHFRCEHPPHSGSLNRNYKSYFSFNSLFLCDSTSRILYIQLSSLGINSDAQLYRDGPLPKKLEAICQQACHRFLPGSVIDMGAFIVADNGFGLAKEVMQPYRSTHLNHENLLFNRELSASRVVVENLFGMLTTRFRVFQRCLNLDPVNSRSLIIALSIVHNVILGKLELDNNFPTFPVLIDRFKSPEQQRTALKKYVLRL